MRTPVVCVVGHVDAGKTSILDHLRHSKIQEEEAGGITQQIGATHFSANLLQKLAGKKLLKIPGLLFIDTPGHDCFTNLRSIGVNICDMAIVVVDVQKGLEVQTLEAIKLLQEAKKPFIILANKLDMIEGWTPRKGVTRFDKLLKKQSKETVAALKKFTDRIVVQVAEQGLNARPYYDLNLKKEGREYHPIIPVSAHSGEGFPDFFTVLSFLADRFMMKRLAYNEDDVRGYVMEVRKDTHGHHVTMVLTNGLLKVGDPFIVNSFKGPMKSTVTKILIPRDNREIKGVSGLASVTEVQAAQGIIITCEGMPKIIPGSRMMVCRTPEVEKVAIKKVRSDFKKMVERLSNFKLSNPGIHIHAASVGAVEAVRSLFARDDVPISGTSIGPISKRVVTKIGTIVTSRSKAPDREAVVFNRRFSVLVVYGMEVPAEIRRLAEESQVTIIDDMIIYRLLETYQELVEGSTDELEQMHPNVYPLCMAEILEEHVYRTTSPFVIGVRIDEGTLFKGMILNAHHLGASIRLGRVVSIQKDHHEMGEVGAGDEVCLKIEKLDEDPTRTYGRHFDSNYSLETFYTDADVRMLRRFPTVFPLGYRPDE